jgi:hypothetical protein
MSSLKQGHEWLGKRLKSVKEGLQGALATGGIPKQNGHKVNDLIIAKSATGQSHLSRNSLENSLFPKASSDNDDFSKPSGNRRLLCLGRLDLHAGGRYVRHENLQFQRCFLLRFSDIEGQFFGFSPSFCLSLRIPWADPMIGVWF